MTRSCLLSFRQGPGCNVDSDCCCHWDVDCVCVRDGWFGCCPKSNETICPEIIKDTDYLFDVCDHQYVICTDDDRVPDFHCNTRPNSPPARRPTTTTTPAPATTTTAPATTTPGLVVNVNFGYLNHGLVKEVITVRNEVAKVMFLRLSVSHSVHRGECYPSIHCRWYPSMPCSWFGGVSAPGPRG